MVKSKGNIQYFLTKNAVPNLLYAAKIDSKNERVKTNNHPIHYKVSLTADVCLDSQKILYQMWSARKANFSKYL